MNNIRNQKGFTLIELMIVIAILAILLAIAIPAYQDYSIRAKVSECVNLAASAKLAVSETALSNGTWPTTNAEAGYDGAQTEYCDSITIGAAGVITAVTRNTGAQGTAPQLTFTPTAAGITTTTTTAIEWVCLASVGNPKYVPAECRPGADAEG